MGSVQVSEGCLSLEDFKKLVMTLEPQQLAAIPVERLPEVIPEEVFQYTPAGSRAVVEDFIFELNSREIQLQIALADRFSREIVDALNLTKQYSQMPYQEVFNVRVSELLLLYKQWGTKLNSEQRQWLVAKIREIDRIVPEFRMESKCVIRAFLILEDELAHAGEYTVCFKSAICELKDRFNRVEDSLSRYFFLRLAVIGGEMTNLENRVMVAQNKTSELQARVDGYHIELEKIKSSFGFFMGRTKEAMLNKLKDKIRVCMEEKQTQDVMIGETDLTGWLDVIVDASVGAVQPRNGESILRKVRASLYRLLTCYCNSQEEAALQIARNPFLLSDPKKSIRFMLQSEQFILDYFSNKRHEMAAWLGDAAESKVQQLKELEKGLLKELKRNSRFQ